MNVSFDFSGRTALITGAAQGIGLEIARLFHQSGARIVPVDKDIASLKEAWGTRTDSVAPLALDVTDEDAVAAGIADATSWAGSLDIAVNNAGITRDAVVWKMSPDQWELVLRVHLGGTFNITRSVIPQMRNSGFGRIVNVTSYTGMHGNIGQSNYAAAKAGIIGFTKTVAKEIATFGITVNAISPNASTAMVAAIPQDRLAALTAAVPMQRFAAPAEMAPAVAFLASDAGAYITGTVLPVDGGMSM